MQTLKDVDAVIFSDFAKEKPALNEEETMTPKEFLQKKYVSRYSFGNDSLQRSGVYLLGGWQFNFRPYMKKYLVKQYGDWKELWAPNKTLIRKALYGKIDKIVQL